MWDVHGFGVFFWTESTDPSPLELVQETTHRKSWSKSMGLLPWQSPWRGLLFCRLRVSREAQRPRFYRITMKMSWDLKPWTHVFNSLFSTNGSCKQVRKLYLERICLDGSSQNLPSALATVSEQYLSSPYATEEVVEGGVIISKKPLLLIILGPSGSQSLEACEPTNQRINFSLLRCIKKVVASTLSIFLSHSPFPHFFILGEGVFERHRSPFPRHRWIWCFLWLIWTDHPRALAKGPKGQRLPPKEMTWKRIMLSWPSW